MEKIISKNNLKNLICKQKEGLWWWFFGDVFWWRFLYEVWIWKTMNLGIMRFSAGYENDWIGLIDIGLMHWLFLRNKYGTCVSHFKNFESQLRSSCFFLMKSLYNSYKSPQKIVTSVTKLADAVSNLPILLINWSSGPELQATVILVRLWCW